MNTELQTQCQTNRRGHVPGRDSVRCLQSLWLLFALSFSGGCGNSEAIHPKTQGRLGVTGIEARLSIRRDSQGTPHIEARGASDAWFGLGFSHAQDRLGQMLWLRRLARGEAAEVAGDWALPVDQLVRTLGIGIEADRAAEALEPSSRTVLSAYSAGINARLGRLAPEVVPGLLRTGTESPGERDWVPADSLAILKLLSWTMGPSLDAPLVFSDIVEEIGGLGARPLLPTGLGIQGIGINFEHARREPVALLRAEAEPMVQDSIIARSRKILEATVLRVSAWAVAGRVTKDGMPILAAEFQLAPTAPVLVYEAHLRSNGLDVVGVTIPGLPLFWAGRNADVAWALTPGRSNTLQLYRETLRDAQEGREYQVSGRWLPVEEREEVIRVRTGRGDLREVRFTVSRTGHGPIINPLLASEQGPISVDWLGAGRGDGMSALLGLLEASDCDDIIQKLAGHQDPVLSVLAIDRKGEVRRQLAGWIPKRLLASGHLPAPGRQAAFNWNVGQEIASLPSAATEPGGANWLISADNALIEGKLSRRIEWLWRYGARSTTIEHALVGRLRAGEIDIRDLSAMQGRLVSTLDPAIISAIARLLRGAPPLTPEAREAWDYLQGWDRRFAPDRRGAAIYKVFIENLTRGLLESHLPRVLVNRYLALAWSEPSLLTQQALLGAAREGLEGGWSDPANLMALLPGSLHQAWISLAYQRGPNREQWTWGGLHQMSIRSFIPRSREAKQVLPGYGGERRYPGVGGVVGMADFDSLQPYAVRSAALYRIALDLASSDRILSSLAPGQSELPGHLHYADGLSSHLRGQPRQFAMSAFLVEEHTKEILTLEPVP